MKKHFKHKEHKAFCCDWVIDLIDNTHHCLADLKTQNTPFFTCGKYHYGLKRYNPSYTVTFNKKDYEHYRDQYPDCEIFFWINWTQTEYSQIKVEAVKGVWVAKFAVMAKMIEEGKVVLHSYLHRKDDDHNAKDSYLFDLNDKTVFLRIL